MHTLSTDPAAALAAAEDHLAQLQERRELAREQSHPGPTAKDIATAKKRVQAAKAAVRGRRK